MSDGTALPVTARVPAGAGGRGRRGHLFRGERGDGEMRGEHGYVLVVVALMGVGLMGVAALALDAGRGYLTRMELQDAVDAAALAGVRELPGDPEGARRLALEYASRHGLSPEQVDVRVMTASEAGGQAPTAGEPPSVLRVTAAVEASTSFARVWGIADLPVAASGEAAVAPLAGARGIVPLGVPDQEFVVGEWYALKLAGGEGEHGNFQALSLGGRGASNYEDRLARGWGELVRVGEWLPTEPGNMSGPTYRGIEERMARARPAETFEDFAPDSPRLLLVPVVDFSGACGRDRVQVVGFAHFYLEDCTGRGSECWIIGRFVRRAVPGELGGWDGASSWHALGIRLTR